MKAHEMHALYSVLHAIRDGDNKAQEHQGELFVSTSFELADGSRLELGCADFDWCGEESNLCEGEDVGLIVRHLTESQSTGNSPLKEMQADMDAIVQGGNHE